MKLSRIIKIALAVLCLGALTACDPTPVGEPGEFRLKATVNAVEEHLEVEVYDSDYAFGIYHVITDAATAYYNESGDRISRSDIKQDDKVEIYYGGQTMQSYPPQIYSMKIVKAS